MFPSATIFFLFFYLKAGLSHTSKPLKDLLLPRTASIPPSGAGQVVTSASSALSCYPQDQDPDQGILSAFCICNGTESLPQITPTPPQYYQNLTVSCAYQTIPPCQTCTSLGFPGGGCASMSNCELHGASATPFPSTTLALSTEREESAYGIGGSTKTSNEDLSLAHTITSAPSKTSMASLLLNTSTTQSDECLLQNPYCSLRGAGHSMDGLTDECILWDSSCSGNRVSATSHFYGSIANTLMGNTCFFDPSPDCSTKNPPGRISAFDEVKDWMRSPQCMSENPTIISEEEGDEANVIKEDLFLNETCCGNCEVAADRVDVYYWSDPHANNTSCLSIVGDGISDLAVAATTGTSGDLYWGCTSWVSYPGQSGPASPLIVPTATLTSVASMTFRTYLFDPWGESPCQGTSPSLSSNISDIITPRGSLPSLYPRGHSLVVPNASVSTAVLGNFTFTSPSIYINFQGLNAGDNCGTTYISSTMIDFSVGDLSTIAGHVQRFASLQQFNPGDFPCPPQSIMSQNWYTPLPGVPYRPFFAFPDKVRQVIPFFKYCDAFWFSVFDPPRALVPGLALAPDVTTDEPTASSKMPMPSPVPDPGPKQTPSDKDPATTPAAADHPQVGPQPTYTAILPGQVPANNEPSPPTHKAPIPPDPNVQQPAQSADPPQGEDPNHPVNQDPTSPGDVSPNSSEDEDPDDPVNKDPAPQGKVSTPTTIQLGQQPKETPTTIFVGGKVEGEESSFGIGALIINAFGKIDPTPKPDGSSDPKASVADPASSFPTVTVAGQALTISNPSAVSIAGTVLIPGGAEATIAGTPVSLAPSGNLVVGTAPSHESSTVLTIAGHTITANPTSFQIAGTPVKAGGPAVTVSGTAISMGLSGNLIIGGGASITSPPATIFTVGAQKFTADGADLVVSGTTIRAGGSAALVAGTSVSLGPSGVLVVGSTTTTLAGFPQSSILTVGGHTFTANPTKFSIGGATLSAGGPGITVNNTLISLNPSGSLLIGTSTIPLQSPTATIITTDGQTFTVEQGGMIVVGGITLSSGGPGTILNGTPITFGSGGLVVGSGTVPLPTVNGTTIPFTGTAAMSAKSLKLVSLGLLVVIMTL